MISSLAADMRSGPEGCNATADNANPRLLDLVCTLLNLDGDRLLQALHVLLSLGELRCRDWVAHIVPENYGQAVVN